MTVIMIGARVCQRGGNDGIVVIQPRTRIHTPLLTHQQTAEPVAAGAVQAQAVDGEGAAGHTAGGGHADTAQGEQARLLPQRDGGAAVRALWVGDFHHDRNGHVCLSVSLAVCRHGGLCVSHMCL